MRDEIQVGEWLVQPSLGRISRGSVSIHVRPKVMDLLVYLAARSGDVVSKQNILDDVWKTDAISESALTRTVTELRLVLGDAADAPRVLETIPKRGYRLIAPVTHALDTAPAPAARAVDAPRSSDGHPRGGERVDPLHDPNAARLSPLGLVVGRDEELAFLRTCVERAAAGRAQCVFVSGEAGIGKTALLRRFLLDCAREKPAVAEGFAAAPFGLNDPFGPVLEALRRLGRDDPSFAALLARHAPSWMSHLPSLRQQDGSADVPVQAATRGRMLREITGALEATTIERPLILVLEDVHWADEPTLSLVNQLGRHPITGRLLTICTYRPSSSVGAQRIDLLSNELATAGQAALVTLEGLRVPAIVAYLQHRWPRLSNTERVASALFDRTDGNPLFMIACLDALVMTGQLADRIGAMELVCSLDQVRRMLPASLAEVIRVRLGRLPDTHRRLLQAASVVGPRFSTSLLSVVTGGDESTVDQILNTHTSGPEPLVERTSAAGVETGAACFAFTHTLYADVLERSLPVTIAAELHGRVAEALEARSGRFESREDISVELAMHFDRAGLPARAVPMYTRAVDLAVSRTAYPEALRHAERALRLLQEMPASREREQAEIDVQLRLGAVVSWTDGFGDPRVAAAFSRALELCRDMPDSPQIVPALLGLSRFFGSCGPVSHALATSQRAIALSRRLSDRTMLVESLHHAATVEFFAGHLADAEDKNAEATRLLSASEPERVTVYLTGLDGRVICSIARAYMLWLLGRFRESDILSQTLSAMVPATRHVETLGCLLAWLAVLKSLKGDDTEAAGHAEAAISLGAGRDDAINYLPFGCLALGRERCRSRRFTEGTALIQQGLERAAWSWRPIGFAFLAEAYADVADWQRALETADRALAETARTGVQYFDAELLRLRGLALRASRPGAAGEAAWEAMARALATARGQGSRWLELRAARAIAESGEPDSLEPLRGVVAALATEDCIDLGLARTRLASAGV